MSNADDKRLGHWIVPGDWVIREAPDPQPESEFSEFVNPTGFALATHAIHVLGVTKSHMTIYDPVVARKSIIQFSYFPGSWRKATKIEVDATWDMAVVHRDRHALGTIDAEKNQYKFRDTK